MCVCVCVCACIRSRARHACMGVRLGLGGTYVAYITLIRVVLNLNCIYLNTIFSGLYFCVLFVNAPYEWNVTKTFWYTC